MQNDVKNEVQNKVQNAVVNEVVNKVENEGENAVANEVPNDVQNKVVPHDDEATSDQANNGTDSKYIFRQMVGPPICCVTLIGIRMHATKLLCWSVDWSVNPPRS